MIKIPRQKDPPLLRLKLLDLFPECKATLSAWVFLSSTLSAESNNEVFYHDSRYRSRDLRHEVWPFFPQIVDLEKLSPGEKKNSPGERSHLQKSEAKHAFRLGNRAGKNGYSVFSDSK